MKKIRMTNDEIRKPHWRGVVSSFEFRHSGLRRAFTLIELIMVLALLVIITSIAVPTMSRFVRGRALDSEARRMFALMHAAQSRAVSEGMPMMLWIDVDNGFYPKTLQDLVQQPGNAKNWHGPYLDKIPMDPWGNNYIYYYPGKHNASSYDLLSIGPDAKEGTGDDIGNWTK